MGRFYSETRRPTRIVQPATCSVEPDYEERVDTKTGKKYLKKVGETNVYEKIQAASEGCTLKDIIKRYGIDPFSSAEKLETETGEILDYTRQPKNLMEALEITNNARNLFENASKEIKQKFNNNFTEFLAAANNGTLEKTLKEFKPEVIDIEKLAKEQITTNTTAEPTGTPVSTGVKYE